MSKMTPDERRELTVHAQKLMQEARDKMTPEQRERYEQVLKAYEEHRVNNS
jgi:hypothetical protein